VSRHDGIEGDEPRAVYNPEDGSLELRTGGPAVTVDGLTTALRFERMTPAGDSAAALWLDAQEVDVLAKMIRHIVERVKITEQSRQTLEDLLPRVEELSRGSGPAEA